VKSLLETAAVRAVNYLVQWVAGFTWRRDERVNTRTK
jgi:hypothetical protein